jgi:hypothetical protein
LSWPVETHLPPNGASSRIFKNIGTYGMDTQSLDQVYLYYSALPHTNVWTLHTIPQNLSKFFLKLMSW